MSSSRNTKAFHSSDSKKSGKKASSVSALTVGIASLRLSKKPIAGASYEFPVDMTKDDDDDVPVAKVAGGQAEAKVAGGKVLMDAVFSDPTKSGHPLGHSMVTWSRVEFINVGPHTTIEQLVAAYMGSKELHEDTHYHGHYLHNMACHSVLAFDLDDREWLTGISRVVSMSDGIDRNSQIFRLSVGPSLEPHLEPRLEPRLETSAAPCVEPDVYNVTVIAKVQQKEVVWPKAWFTTMPLGSTIGDVIEKFMSENGARFEGKILTQNGTYQNCDGGPYYRADIVSDIEMDGILTLTFV
jgi:hypothetical protein